MVDTILSLFPLEKIKEFRFNPRSEPIPVNLRIMYQISQILLVLKFNSIKSRASHQKIHLFLNNMDNEDKMEEMIRVDVSKESEFRNLIINFNPYVTRAIKLGILYDFLKIENKKTITFSNNGKILLKFLETNKDLFNFDIKHLTKIGNKFNETVIKKIINK